MLGPGDDIEDIYKDFAEKYPLVAGDSDWDDFSQKLDKATADKDKPGVMRSFLKKRYAIAAAILFLGIIIWLYKPAILPGKNNNTNSNPIPANTSAIKQPASAVKKQGQAAPSQQQKLNHTNTVTEQENTSQAMAGVQTGTVPEARPTKMQNNPGKKSTVTAKLSSPVKYSINSRGSNVGNNQATQVQPQTQSPSQITPPPQTPPITEPNSTAFTNNKDSVNNIKEESLSPLAQSAPLNTAAANKATTANAAAKKPVSINTARKKYFYISLLFGPDLSTVKYENIKGPGLSGGIMAGYQLTKKWGFETGLLLDRKLYYSAGKYFNKSAVNLSGPDESIVSVDGDGTLFEIPVAVRFSFAGNKNHHLFASAGMSSYFIQKEKYHLFVEHSNGIRRHQDDDDDDFTNIFSVAQASIGYDLKLSERNFLRIEPYIKIPLSGIGKGSLPLTSNGVYINFTHAFN